MRKKTLCNEDGKGTDQNRKLSACLAGGWGVGSPEARDAEKEEEQSVVVGRAR